MEAKLQELIASLSVIQKAHVWEPTIEAVTDISFKAGVEVGVKQGRQEVIDITEPMMLAINKLSWDIRGDWTDPRHECREIQSILSKWQGYLKEWGAKEDKDGS